MTTAGLLRPHLAFFIPHDASRPLTSRRAARLQRCTARPAAAAPGLAPRTPGGRWVPRAGTPPATAASSAPLLPPLPGLPVTLCLPPRRAPSSFPREAEQALAPASSSASRRGQPRHCRAPLHPDRVVTRCHTPAVTRTPRPAGSKGSLPAEPHGAEPSTTSRCFLVEGTEPPARAVPHPSCASVEKRDALRCWPPGAWAGGPAPQPPQGMRTRGMVVPTQSAGSGPRGEGVQEAERHFWGLRGRAAEEMLSVLGTEEERRQSHGALGHL